ncbi:MAG TPA: LptE family protein [Pirellulaceae bacterium]|nr:LptE family protein [Pirellulaceae bacterium]
MPVWLLLASFVLTPLAGCATYRLGACSLYRPDIQTVHVPVIKSASFRRNLGEQLTEAVVKEIELKSPYKVVGAEGADSVLEVRIDSDTKRVVAENAYDEGRELETRFQIHFTWRDRQGNLITRSALPLEDTVVGITASSNFLPEFGQSTVTSQQKAIQRLATQIVGQMEAGW